MASAETDFDAKTATVTMQPGRDLTAAAVIAAFEGSRYTLDGAIERLDDRSP